MAVHRAAGRHLGGMAALAAAGASAVPLDADLSWMAGHWLECSPRGEAAETWADDRGGVMLGLSKSIRDGRTSWELSRRAVSITSGKAVGCAAERENDGKLSERAFRIGASG